MLPAEAEPETLSSLLRESATYLIIIERELLG